MAGADLRIFGREHVALLFCNRVRFVSPSFVTPDANCFRRKLLEGGR
jgi:hypothetical protein